MWLLYLHLSKLPWFRLIHFDYLVTAPHKEITTNPSDFQPSVSPLRKTDITSSHAPSSPSFHQTSVLIVVNMVTWSAPGLMLLHHCLFLQQGFTCESVIYWICSSFPPHMAREHKVLFLRLPSPFPLILLLSVMYYWFVFPQLAIQYKMYYIFNSLLVAALIVRKGLTERQ